VQVTNNTALYSGGGLALVKADAGITIQNSTIAGNNVGVPMMGGNGGGVVSLATNVTVLNSTISGNTSQGAGGGILIADAPGTLIENSTVTGNTAQIGGGVANAYGPLSVSEATLTG